MNTSRLTSEDWIKTGLHALAANGPNALKAERLARDIGATKGSFYWHFKDISDFRTRMLRYWQDQTSRALERVMDEAGSASQRLYRLADLARQMPEEYGGTKLEPAMRAWAYQDHTVTDVIAEIDRKRLAYTAELLSDLGLSNPELARLFYGANIGMGVLSAIDGQDNAGALSTLTAALLSLQEA